MTTMRRTQESLALRLGRILLTMAAVAAVPVVARAQQQVPRFGVSVEAGSIWSNRNDVRIPSATGTEFSIVDLIGAGPSPAVRFEATADVNDRHGFKLTYAPVRVNGSGVLGSPTSFAGTTFAAAPADAAYQFDSYRATYRYRFYNGATWRWKVGFTAFVRDARIALDQPGRAAEDTDVGFVPLAHLSGEARLSDKWRWHLELDGSAAPQGRALDLAAMISYQVRPRLSLSAGYRTIEGGADVDPVYTFAWLNAAVVRATITF